MNNYQTVDQAVKENEIVSLEKLISLTGLSKSQVQYNIRKNPNIVKKIGGVFTYEKKLPFWYPVSLVYSECKSLQAILAVYLIKTRDFKINSFRFTSFCKSIGIGTSIIEVKFKNNVTFRNTKKDVMRKIQPYL